MSISRQHSETEVAELVGRRCRRLLGIPGATADTVLVLYMLADDAWFRLFLDAGLFFLDECGGPDPDDDLAPGESYIDFGARLPSDEALIEQVRMKDGTLVLRLSNGASVSLREVDDKTHIEVSAHGTAPG